MNITYEEAMRRIDEYEKYDTRGYKCCRETRFPFDIYLYRGEGQILVVPLTQSMFWYRRYLGVYCSLNDSESAVNIGMKVYKSMNKKFT
ncbi:MAG: hypothetical protein HPZ99_09225 [Oscillospiraceae bacterium]|jgi:hypothetical protein|nr:hypothetical protein [Oscillospiraceae bacterium]